MVSLIASAVLDKIKTAQEVQQGSGDQNVTYLADTFFLIPELESSQVQFAI